MPIEKAELRVGLLLESSHTKKAMIIPYFLSFVFSQYILFDIYILINPSKYINTITVYKALPFKIIFLTLMLLVILMQKKIELNHFFNKIIAYVLVIFYVSSLMFLGYLIGHMSVVTGIVIAAAPLFSMILYKDSVTIVLILTGVITILTIYFLYITGVIPYAPLYILSATPDIHEKIFVLISMLFFVVPHLMSFIGGTYLLVRYWRIRENTIRTLSLTDSLTEMANRRAICDYLMLVMAQRTPKQPLSIILVDIDYFKKINDTFGHMMGDQIIRRVGNSIKNSLRGTDQVGRYGGEEFLIVLPNTTLSGGKQIAERCRQHIEQELTTSPCDQQIRVTASFGVYCSLDYFDDMAEMIRNADMQLYRAKEEGRNRVCIYQHRFAEI